LDFFLGKNFLVSVSGRGSTVCEFHALRKSLYHESPGSRSSRFIALFEVLKLLRRARLIG
jgi:hypothetical protein